MVPTLNKTVTQETGPFDGVEVKFKATKTPEKLWDCTLIFSDGRPTIRATVVSEARAEAWVSALLLFYFPNSKV